MPVSDLPALSAPFLLLSGASGANVTDAARPVGTAGAKGIALAFLQNPSDAPAGVRRITFEQAQQLSTAASDPLVRLGQLQVEVAKQHRLGVQSLYIPERQHAVLRI